MTTSNTDGPTSADDWGDQPTPKSVLSRPRGVLIGCIMAWVGCLVLAFYGSTLLQAGEDSPLFKDVDPADIPDQLTAVHAAGISILIWAGLIALLAGFAYYGFRYAANALLGLAGLLVPISLYALATGGSIAFLIVVIWSMTSATLIRTRGEAKAWWSALKTRKAAGKAEA